MSKTREKAPIIPIQQSGFTLIEVLVAVIILSIGLLGIAGLQTTGLKNNQSAYLQSQAIIYAYDIIESMRANRTAALDEDYDIATGTDANASGTTIADTDLTEWRTRIANNLPGSSSSVANNSGKVTVSITWNDSHVPDGLNNRNITIESEL